ncbi:NodB Homologuey domain-containing protein [Trichophyton interdigitale]|uniref:NodB homology domain-containing protein n=1 Tax=Trichophyton interdigitale TaxID=101480 RepID=A0A9P5CUG3_9EURO|nr:NodB homology domain-containing protein [Trichophyton interdigitale]KAF3893009.1 NodB homology domain-containing protein [Trichophyton interdigitale]KAG8207875.1 NodB Homologuey domain-containing protein [Trichophyton interdigitale]
MLMRLYTFFVAALLACCTAAGPLHPELPQLVGKSWIPDWWFPFPRPSTKAATTTTRLATSTTRLATTTTQPTTTSSKPGTTSTTKPVTSTPQPATSTAQPAISSTATATATLASTSTSTTSTSASASTSAASPSTPTTVVPFGQIIRSCTVKGTVAITFDDGPYDYTNKLLDIFDANGSKATLFVNAQNFGSITDYSSVMLRAFNTGHQIASHTYNHADLSTLNRAGIISEMTKLDDVLATITNGYRPTYMRAPYFAYSPLVLQTMAELKYHVIEADIDTKDYEHDTPDGVSVSVGFFRDGLNAGGSIALAHDVHQTTVDLLIQQLLDELKRRGLRAVTVGECLGDPRANWYRTTPVQVPTGTSTTSPTATPTSPGTPPPAPTQPGVASNCQKWHTVVSGDTCYDIAAANGISLDNLYKWNPAVGTNCASLWLGYAVCVGI